MTYEEEQAIWGGCINHSKCVDCVLYVVEMKPKKKHEKKNIM